MALLPLLFGDFPSTSQRKDYLSLFSAEDAMCPFRNVLNQLAGIEKDQSIVVDKDQFQANIDVQQFKPEEITVKLEGDSTVIVEGKHEEKQDEHGYISRQFVRRYVLPADCDIQKLKSKLSSDGVLIISAPKKPVGKEVEWKEIPVTFTGPVHSVEQKPKESDAKTL